MQQHEFFDNDWTRPEIPRHQAEHAFVERGQDVASEEAFKRFTNPLDTWAQTQDHPITPLVIRAERAGTLVPHPVKSNVIDFASARTKHEQH